MLTTRSQGREGSLAQASRTSITQKLSRVAALHPWRIVVAWGLILVASVLAIATLLGSAFTSDASLTTSPDSTKAAKVIADNFSQGDRIDEAVIIHSAKLKAESPEFKAFVADVRSSIEGTGAAQTVRDPYAADQRAISEDGQRRS